MIASFFCSLSNIFSHNVRQKPDSASSRTLGLCPKLLQGGVRPPLDPAKLRLCHGVGFIFIFAVGKFSDYACIGRCYSPSFSNVNPKSTLVQTHNTKVDVQVATAVALVIIAPAGIGNAHARRILLAGDRPHISSLPHLQRPAAYRAW